MKTNKIYNYLLIKEFIFSNNLTEKEFCEKCKIDICDLNKIKEDNLDLDLEVVFKIAFYIKVQVHKMFVDKK